MTGCVARGHSGSTSISSVNSRAVASDLLGHGKSDKPDSISYTIPELVINLDLALTKVIAKEKFVIMEHSLGGLISLHYATTPGLSNRLRVLVFLNTSPTPRSRVLEVFRRTDKR